MHPYSVTNITLRKRGSFNPNVRGADQCFHFGGHLVSIVSYEEKTGFADVHGIFWVLNRVTESSAESPTLNSTTVGQLKVA